MELDKPIYIWFYVGVCQNCTSPIPQVNMMQFAIMKEFVLQCPVCGGRYHSTLREAVCWQQLQYQDGRCSVIRSDGIDTPNPSPGNKV